MPPPAIVRHLALVGTMAGLVACGSADGAPSPADANAPQGQPAAFECGTSGDIAPGVSAPRHGQRLQVVTTVAPITSIVANIAGDRADVAGVIPEGQDSHTYEPKPSVAALFSRADVVFVNGLELEDPTKEIAERNIPGHARVVELGTLTIGPDEYLYDASFPRAAGRPNPHLWTNPPMARCYATIAASVLATIDPTNAPYYRENAARYAAKLDELDRLVIDATATIPPQHRELLTYHDAYAYFAARYGWRVIGAIQVSSFEDPTPKEVAELISQIEREDVPAIFGSEVFPSPVLEQMANETGAAYVDALRDDDLPGAPGEPGHSYLGLMRFDLVTMVSSLGGDASKLASFDITDVAPDGAHYPQ